jgi:hypothetical protein
MTLISVIQNDVAEPAAGCRLLTGMEGGECVTELVAWPRVDRPFLSECVNPILAVPESLEVLNVLHDSEFLIVGFLDQETVVLNVGRVVPRRLGRFRVFRRFVYLGLFSARAFS